MNVGSFNVVIQISGLVGYYSDFSNLNNQYKRFKMKLKRLNKNKMKDSWAREIGLWRGAHMVFFACSTRENVAFDLTFSTPEHLFIKK
jgi:hypothetical protein